ncbi:MAG: hypothetical protein Roseis2KO_36730 [Roseivirga sp.]
MAELFKNIYNTGSLGHFAAIVQEVVPAFKKEAFIKAIFDKGWESKELKQRMRHIAITLHTHLSCAGRCTSTTFDHRRPGAGAVG